MSLLEFCRWLQYSGPLHAMRDSPIFFPIIATIHLMGLALIGGAVLVVDLRLLGFGVQGQPIAVLAHDAERWLLRGLAVMVFTGTLLFYAAPLNRYENIFFRVKMGALALAVLNIWWFRRTAYRRVHEWDLDPVPPRRVRMVGALSLILLALIITAGRMMAYQDYWFG